MRKNTTDSWKWKINSLAVTEVVFLRATWAAITTLPRVVNSETTSCRAGSSSISCKKFSFSLPTHRRYFVLKCLCRLETLDPQLTEFNLCIQLSITACLSPNVINLRPRLLTSAGWSPIQLFFFGLLFTFRNKLTTFQNYKKYFNLVPPLHTEENQRVKWTDFTFDSRNSDFSCNSGLSWKLCLKFFFQNSDFKHTIPDFLWEFRHFSQDFGYFFGKCHLFPQNSSEEGFFVFFLEIKNIAFGCFPGILLCYLFLGDSCLKFYSQSLKRWILTLLSQN